MHMSLRKPSRTSMRITYNSFITRNNLIRGSAEYFSEEERMEMGMIVPDNVKSLHSDIREVRGAKSEAHKNHVDITKYGIDRSDAARMKRIQKMQGMLS